MIRGRIGRVAAALMMVIGVVFLAASPAAAHSETLRSDPPNGGMVPEGRTSLTLWFDEPVGYDASIFAVRTIDGLEIETSTEFENGADRIVIETPPLERGQYVIDWHALSLVDGHASSGTIVFGAGLRPDAVAAEGAGPPTIDLLVLRWLDLGVLLLALGSLAVGGRVLGAAGDGGERIRDRVRWVGALAAGAAVYAGLVTPFLRTRGSGGFSAEWLDQTWLTLTQTGWGQLWLAREVALVVAAVAFLRWRRTRGQESARRVALGALVVAVCLEEFGGHAAALPTGTTVDALMGAAHVLASGVWVGGLMLLVLTLVPVMRRDTGAEQPARGAVWRAYSPMAAISSVVLMATGLYQAGQHVPDLGSLRTTVYGGAVAGKVVLVTVALALAGINTLLINRNLAERFSKLTRLRPPGPSTRTLTRTVQIEAAVLGSAVLVAAVLTTVPTAREVAVATRPSAPHVANVDGLFMTFEPVREGADRYRLILRMRSTIQPEPAPIIGVDVDVLSPAGDSERVTLDLVQAGQDPSEDTRYEGSTSALDPGDWEGTIAVHRSGLVDTTMIADWNVAPPAAELASSLRTLLSVVAGLMLAGLATVLILLRRRRTPRGDSDPRHPTLERSSR